MDLCLCCIKRTLEVLKWARENNCPWDKLTCSYAASNGHLEVLKWARANNCPWDAKNCSATIDRMKN